MSPNPILALRNIITNIWQNMEILTNFFFINNSLILRKNVNIQNRKFYSPDSKSNLGLSREKSLNFLSLIEKLFGY